MADAAQDGRTLWIGDIDQWMDENYFKNLFSPIGDVSSVKIIRDKSTMFPAGYGFVEFSNHASAQRVLEQLNGQTISGTNKTYRLNWATFGFGDKSVGNVGGGDYSIFVGDLSADVTDHMLNVYNFLTAI